MTLWLSVPVLFRFVSIGRGPGTDMFESTKIIGARQAAKGQELFDSATIQLSGPVDFIHTYLNMANTTVTFNGSLVNTCLPSMGYSFAAGTPDPWQLHPVAAHTVRVCVPMPTPRVFSAAFPAPPAGTTDGPGAFNFTQGDAGTGTPFWNEIRDLIATPSQAQIDCQAPKPILLPTGETTKPYAWDPEIVALQILRIGQFFLVCVPGEFTTMGGRRMRNAVREAIIASGGPEDAIVIISGLSNSYSSYVTTFEEYQVRPV
jgi:neutral ceramidase